MKKALNEALTTIYGNEDDFSEYHGETSLVHEKMEEIAYLRSKKLNVENVTRIVRPKIDVLKRTSLKLKSALLDKTVPNILKRRPIDIDLVNDVDRVEHMAMMQIDEKLNMIEKRQKRKRLLQNRLKPSQGRLEGFSNGSNFEAKENYLTLAKESAREEYFDRTQTKIEEKQRKLKELEKKQSDAAFAKELARLGNQTLFWKQKEIDARKDLNRIQSTASEDKKKNLKLETDMTTEHLYDEQESGLFSLRQNTAFEKSK